jgi:hypothetical protein
MGRWLRPGLSAVSALIVFALVVAGCGGSSDSTGGDAIAHARQEGEAAAHERDRVSALQHRVERLERKHRRAPARRGTVTAPAARPRQAVAPSPASSTVAPVEDEFHTPSGNVACRLDEEGATCSVGPTETTFTMIDGGPAAIDSGIVVPMGSGDLAEYGTTITAGDISCEVPPSDVPRGVTCVDSGSGHGFEASRIAARTDAY